MKRKKYHRNKLTQSDDYNPFDEIWFWLHLASISIEYTDFICNDGKHDVMQNDCVDKQNPHPSAPQTQ
jgi:hypothetical protein